MSVARYLHSCVDLSGLTIKTAKTSEYTTAKEFAEAQKHLPVERDGYLRYFSILGMTTHDYSTGQKTTEDAAANLKLLQWIPYVGNTIVGEIDWSKGTTDHALYVGYLYPTKAFDNASYGILKSEWRKCSAEDAYEFIKANIMNINEAGEFANRVYIAVKNNAKGQLRYVNTVDPSKMNDAKYLKRMFTAKQIEAINRNEIGVVQILGKGRKYYKFNDDILPVPAGKL